MWKRKTFVSSIIIGIIIITITTAATTMTYYPCYYVATWHFKADPALYFPAASGWAGHRFGILFWDNSEAVTVSSPRGGKALGMRPSRSIATSEEVLTSVSCPRHPLLRPSLSLSLCDLPAKRVVWLPRGHRGRPACSLTHWKVLSLIIFHLIPEAIILHLWLDGCSVPRGGRRY